MLARVAAKAVAVRVAVGVAVGILVVKVRRCKSPMRQYSARSVDIGNMGMGAVRCHSGPVNVPDTWMHCHGGSRTQPYIVTQPGGKACVVTTACLIRSTSSIRVAALIPDNSLVIADGPG